MEYNYSVIYERIRSERKNKKLSQTKLIEKLEKYNVQIGRNTLSDIENGSYPNIPLNFLTAFAKICECDVGYLLGEYDHRTIENKDICDATGLFESAVETLKTLKTHTEKYQDVSGRFTELDCLNFIMNDSRQFMEFLDNVASYIDNDFTTPLHYEDKIPVASQQPHGFPEITIGKQIGTFPDGSPMYAFRGMPLETIETYYLLEAQNAIRDWKKQYQNKK